MTDQAYAALVDPYCYPGTAVIKNIPGFRDQAALGRFEAMATAQRAEEPLPVGRLAVRHYRAIHHHLFQDVYRWAGRFRTVRIAKGDSMFCYPEYIPEQMNTLFAELKGKGLLRELAPNAFAVAAARFLGTLNAIHPFRDGNGRAQLVFLALLADRAGHPLNLERLDPDSFLAAMIGSFNGNDRALSRCIYKLIRKAH